MCCILKMTRVGFWTTHVMLRLFSDNPSHPAQAVGYTNESDVQSLFARADLDGSGDIDYPEYERLMNMERLGDEFVSVPLHATLQAPANLCRCLPHSCKLSSSFSLSSLRLEKMVRLYVTNGDLFLSPAGRQRCGQVLSQEWLPEAGLRSHRLTHGRQQGV